jgi:cell division protein ZapA (FtsZ GTPase activity inhibitor)
VSVARGVEVSLLGQTLVLRSDLDPDRLRQIVEYVRRKAEDAARGALTASPASLALLTALNLAEELFAARALVEAGREELRDAEARAGRLVEAIESVLPGEAR